MDTATTDMTKLNDDELRALSMSTNDASEFDAAEEELEDRRQRRIMAEGLDRITPADTEAAIWAEVDREKAISRAEDNGCDED